jgi:hypothetical protein
MTFWLSLFEVLGSNPAISPAYNGLPILRWAALELVLHCRLSSEGQQRIISTKRTSGPQKNHKGKKAKICFTLIDILYLLTFLGWDILYLEHLYLGRFVSGHFVVDVFTRDVSQVYRIVDKKRVVFIGVVDSCVET